jgi:hypothetical protein
MDLQGEKEELDWSHVQAQFEALAASEEIQEGSEPMSFDVLVSSSSEVFEDRISKARAYAQRLGTDNASSPKGHIFINGKYYVIDDVRLHTTLFQRPNSSPVEQNFLDSLQSSVGQALQYFQEKVILLFPDCRYLTIYSC